MCTFRHTFHNFCRRWISWAAVRAGCKSPGIYQKSLHQKLCNQSAKTTFLSDLFVFFCLNVAPTSTREEIIPMRIRISYIVSQSITTTFFFPSFFFVLTASRKKKQIYGAFRFISSPFLRPATFYFLFLWNFHIHTEHLLINHLFRLVYYVISINYPVFGSVLGSCVWLIRESCWTFVCTLLLFNS